jgi:hypothetical protein
MTKMSTLRDFSIALALNSRYNFQRRLEIVSLLIYRLYDLTVWEATVFLISSS